MKICLISPPTITEFSEAQVTHSEAIRLTAEHAPMGILSLAAVLESRGIVPTIVDLNQLYYEYLESEEYRQTLIDFSGFVVTTLDSQPFDIFGFSTICSTYPLTIRLAREVKRAKPGATIILGGPQASVVDVPTLSAFPFIDLIVRGEAEESFPLLLEALRSGGSYDDDIPGITFRQKERIVRKPNGPAIADLDSLPMAAFHLFPAIAKCRYLPLEIGRGCPFACSFCSTNDFFRRQFRLKSANKVLEEMKLLNALYGVDNFELIHDLFTVNAKKVVDFCETLKRSGEKFYWNCSARTDCIDDGLVDLMAEAGCRGIFVGIDSGSERMQKVMNKRLDLSEAALRIEHADSCGIKTTVSLITGFPDERKSDLRATIGFLADSLRFDQAEPQLHLLAPLAETPITTQYKDELIFDDIISDQSYQGWQQEVPDREMIRSHPDIFTNFYAVPTRWLDRYYLKELREFILKGMRRLRWLYVALHQDCGDLLWVFDEWKSWHEKNLPVVSDVRTYYLSTVFRDDFMRFVRSHYLPTIARYPLVVSAILNYQIALCHFDEKRYGFPSESSVKSPDSLTTLKSGARIDHASSTRVTELDVDLKQLLALLRKKGRLDQLPPEPVTLAIRETDEKIEVLQLNKYSERLFRLCDGTRTVSQIVNDFSLNEKGSLGDIPADKASLFGLFWLGKQGLIEAVP